jgi:16S rRNA (adenine1518-N6/adenine1519-N6)-dimethyltransferase
MVRILPSDTLRRVPRDADPGERRPRARSAAADGGTADWRSFPRRKRWGQHFLAAPETAQRIVDAARVRPEDTVFEVGPGGGALSRVVVARGARLLAVEIDPLRARALSREFADNARVAILHGDVLARPFGEWLAEAGWGAPALLLANLPYNAATPILSRAIEEPETISRSVATVQREVARRFAGLPGTEQYGYLSIRAAAFAQSRILFDLPPSAFRPRPKVVSSVLELRPRVPPLDPGLRRRALDLASRGFQGRRKTLANALASVAPRAVWQEALEASGLKGKARAEELSLEDYLELARRVSPRPAERNP